MRRCAVLLECVILRESSNVRQKSLHQQNVSVILSVNFHPRLDEVNRCTTESWNTHWHHDGLGERRTCTQKTSASDVLLSRSSWSVETVILTVAWGGHGEYLFIRKPNEIHHCSWITPQQRLWTVKPCLLVCLSSCAFLFFKRLWRKSRFTMLFTDDREIPSSRAISLCVLCVWGLSSWLSTSSSTPLMLSTVRAVRRRPLPGRLAEVPVESSFLMSYFNPPNDNPLWGNSFWNFLAPYCLFCPKNCIEILSSSLKTIFVNNRKWCPVLFND